MKRRMDMWDWLASTISAAVMAIGIYIYLSVPSAWYYTVVVVGTIAKVLFAWLIAAIIMMIVYNTVKSTVRSDRNRNRTHKEGK